MVGERRRRRCSAFAKPGSIPTSPKVRRWLELAESLLGFPRHLSQHVGGFVIAERPLHELVPIENAAMPERTVIQWDKDDLEELGLLKVDVLGLGMLTRDPAQLRAHRAVRRHAAHAARPFRPRTEASTR